MKKLLTSAVALLLVSAPSSLQADSGTFRIQAVVPVACQVKYNPAGRDTSSDGAVSLGQIVEFCNAPGGYELRVFYQPGSLAGTTIFAGSDRVILDGSGEAVLSRSNAPRIIERAITATPGAAGFNTDQLIFQLNPT